VWTGRAQENFEDFKRQLAQSPMKQANKAYILQQASANQANAPVPAIVREDVPVPAVLDVLDVHQGEIELEFEDQPEEKIYIPLRPESLTNQRLEYFDRFVQLDPNHPEEAINAFDEHERSYLRYLLGVRRARRLGHLHEEVENSERSLHRVLSRADAVLGPSAPAVASPPKQHKESQRAQRPAAAASPMKTLPAAHHMNEAEQIAQQIANSQGEWQVKKPRRRPRR
jgi:hypothetical protein